MIKQGILALFLSFFILAHAQDKKVEKKEIKVKNENLIVTSQHLDYDHINRKAIFLRDVKAINGPTTMKADKMTCYFDENNDPYLIIAEGKVLILKGDHKANAEKAVYKLDKQIIILKHKPELFDGNNTIKARIITFFEAKNISEFDDPDCIFYREIKKKTDDKKPKANGKESLKKTNEKEKK
jgi:lipopolysaccharide transport protein LptA